MKLKSITATHLSLLRQSLKYSDLTIKRTASTTKGGVLQNLRHDLSRNQCFQPPMRGLCSTVSGSSDDKWIIRSKHPDVVIPSLSFPESMCNAVEKYADRVALVSIETGQELTYLQYRDLSMKVASALARLGVSKSDVVAIIAQNCIEYFCTFFGTSFLGATITTVNPAWTAREMIGQLNNAGASIIFCQQADLKTILEVCQEVKSVRHVVVYQGTGEHQTIPFEKLLKDDGKGMPQNVQIDPKNDVLVMPYSSGTTGLPKGVLLTHSSLLANVAQLTAESVKLFNPEESQYVLLCVLPLYHIFAVTGAIVAWPHTGSKVVILKKFESNTFIDAIKKYQITNLHLVPPLLSFLVEEGRITKKDIEKCHSILCGAAPIGPTLLQQFYDKFGKNGRNIIEGYGLTEASGGTHVSDSDNYVIGSCGQTLPNTWMKIVNSESGEPVEPIDGAYGELCIKGPQLMKGYHNNEEATKTTLVNGWLHTGDIVRIDGNQNVFIVDRKKELIKVKGLQVAPAELEDLLRQHPSVEDVAVIGVPDKRSGEVPKAFIVLKEGFKENAQEIKDFVKDKVAHYKRLEGGVKFLKEVPKTASGKILRRTLKETYT